MAESAVFSTPFFGADGKNWPFIGQIADDSTWRDNALSGKFKSANTIPGWGRRYKVRIMGLDDKSEESISSDQLRWGLVNFPITAGSGAANSFQGANLRQGDMVTGFFMDGATQQVPIITGVLGNNAQTGQQKKTGMTGGENFASTSGYAETKEPYKGDSGPQPPDEGLVTEETSSESSKAPPGSVFDKYGLPSGLPKTPAQLADIASAVASAGDLTGSALTSHVAGKVQQGIRNRAATAATPQAGPIKNPTKEHPDGVHQLSARDLKSQAKMCEKIVTMKPDNIVQSSMKAIQTTIENTTTEMNSVLGALQSYSGAVSRIGGGGGGIQSQLKDLISSSACQISKYMKIIFDKVMNYAMKVWNKAMVKVVSAMPMSMRYQMSDMKEKMTELTLCLYGKITNGLCGMMEGILNNLLNPEDAEKKAREQANDPKFHDSATNTYPKVPMCTAEDIVGQALAANKDAINNANQTLLDNLNTFLDDMQKQLAGISGAMSDIMSKMGGVSGNMTAALGFANIKLNVFGCELTPGAGVSDYYTLCRGGSGLPEQQMPSEKAVEKRANQSTAATRAPETGFAEPTKNQPNVSNRDDISTDNGDDDDDDGTTFELF